MDGDFIIGGNILSLVKKNDDIRIIPLGVGEIAKICISLK